MSALKFDALHYHMHIEDSLLTEEFIKEEDAHKAKDECYSFVLIRARLLLCSHLRIYSEINQLDWDMKGFKLLPMNGFKVIQDGKLFKVERYFEPDDYLYRDLDGYMPYGNPAEENSWSVLFRVEDVEGSMVDKQIMSSAPSFSNENDLTKTEMETLLYHFQLYLKGFLNDLVDRWSIVTSNINKNVEQLERSLSSRITGLSSGATSLEKRVKGLEADSGQLRSSFSTSVIILGALNLVSFIVLGFNFYLWHRVGVL